MDTSLDLLTLAEVNRFVDEVGGRLHTHKLASGEQENEHNEPEHCKASDNAGADPIIQKGHVPRANTEGLHLVVVESDVSNSLCVGESGESSKLSQHF